MVTQIAEVDGARIAVGREPDGTVRGAAIWESKEEPGKVYGMFCAQAKGKDIFQFKYEGYRLDHVVDWAIAHMRLKEKQS